MTGKNNIWLNGIMGVVVGDALGCPVQFKSRKEVARHPVTGMRGYGSLQNRLQAGLTRGFSFYESYLSDKENLHYYDRLRDPDTFAVVPVDQIKSSGYVVDSLEAAVWSLITTESFEQALLKAVNLGDDTDTVGAITGGLAGLYYGYDQIPKDWLSAIKRREWIEEMFMVWILRNIL